MAEGEDKEAMKTEDMGEEADVHAIRHRIFTEKGKYYELEQVNDLFISLRNITEKTLTLLSIHSSYDVIRNNYHLWMEKFEIYIERHQNPMSRLDYSDKEKYILEFEDRDAYLQNFKRTIENYFTAKEETRSRHTSKSTKSQCRSQSNHSSVLSNISSRKLMEEQKKAELEAQKAALTKRREIELAKIQLQMEQEELTITTRIAVAEAKSKILDKYEKLEKERSMTNIFALASNKCDQEQKSEINETYVVGLNPTVQDFQPRC